MNSAADNVVSDTGSPRIKAGAALFARAVGDPSFRTQMDRAREELQSKLHEQLRVKKGRIRSGKPLSRIQPRGAKRYLIFS